MMDDHSLRIISDGTPGNTHVFTKEGVELKGITSVKWEIKSVRDLATAVVSFEDVAVNVEGEV